MRATLVAGGVPEELGAVRAAALRDGGAVACGEHSVDVRAERMVDDDRAVRIERHRPALEPVGVRDDADRDDRAVDVEAAFARFDRGDPALGVADEPLDPGLAVDRDAVLRHPFLEET